MPLNKRKYASKRRLIRRKRMGRRGGKTVIVNRALHPIPQRFITKMKYAEQFTTDGNGQYTFNLNSVYDPNRTGIGHQPYGFDTLSTLYNRYRVISCGWRIQPVVTGSSGLSNVQVVAMPANETLSGILSLAELRENPRAKYVTQTVGGGLVTLSGKSYLPSLVGRSKAQYMADDRYQALVTASPNELTILNILSSANATDSGNAATFQIVLEYTVEWFDIKHLVQS